VKGLENIEGVTVVPIRRESTLPPRRFQSEWKSEWKSGIGEEFGTGGGSLMQQQIDRMQQQEEEGKEEVLFDRSHKFSHNRQAWVKPQTHQVIGNGKRFYCFFAEFLRPLEQSAND